MYKLVRKNSLSETQSFLIQNLGRDGRGVGDDESSKSNQDQDLRTITTLPVSCNASKDLLKDLWMQETRWSGWRHHHCTEIVWRQGNWKRRQLVEGITEIIGEEEWSKRLDEVDGGITTVLRLYGDKETERVVKWTKKFLLQSWERRKSDNKTEQHNL